MEIFENIYGLSALIAVMLAVCLYGIFGILGPQERRDAVADAKGIEIPKVRRCAADLREIADCLPARERPELIRTAKRLEAIADDCALLPSATGGGAANHG